MNRCPSCRRSNSRRSTPKSPSAASSSRTPRGNASVEAFDAEDAALGISPTAKAAADAISARAAS